jgi:NADH-quinone oxidoreductase subunit F
MIKTQESYFMRIRIQESYSALLGAYQGRGRDALLPALWDIQTHEGYITPDAVQAISRVLRVPEAEIYGVVEFYTLFHTEPTGKRIVRVCTDPSCALTGADDVLHACEARVGDDVTVEHTTCLGMCDHAPAGLVSDKGTGEKLIAQAKVDNLLGDDEQADYGAHKHSTHPLLLTKADSDYSALRKAVTTMSPEELIAEVVASGLIGRGGAAFPTGLKWRFTRQAPSKTRYVVCNADESEPGTFKDRVLMEQYPHRVLEGIALAAYAIGAEKAFIFIRGEYPVAQKALERAYADVVAQGILGDNMLNTGKPLDIEIRRGAGAYICGEETALFEAIEGKRGFPRIKPPYPTTEGLFGKPTVVNNVETLSAVPAIVLQGADAFSALGTEKSTGTKLVSVSGHVKQAGVYEIVPSMTLRVLLEDLCGGIEGDLQAILMGGAAGTFLTPDQLDVPLTFEDLRGIGSTFGSGAIMVFNTTVDLRDILRRLAIFFQHESCGKCFPCQLGTQRQLEIVERLDHALPDDVVRLEDIGVTMTESSLCGLGQTAASAIMSAMQKFPHLFVSKGAAS